MGDFDNEDDFDIFFMPIVKLVCNTLDDRRHFDYGVCRRVTSLLS